MVTDFYPKLPFGRHCSNSCAFVCIALDSKDVLSGQFPSNSIKAFRKIGWISIPSKFFDNVFDACLHDQRILSKKTLTKFLMDNFDRVNRLCMHICYFQLHVIGNLNFHRVKCIVNMSLFPYKYVYFNWQWRFICQ